MVRADELYNEVMAEATAKGASQGMFIGCSVDTSTGTVSFTCEGKDTSFKFKVSGLYFFTWVLCFGLLDEFSLEM